MRPQPCTEPAPTATATATATANRCRRSLTGAEQRELQSRMERKQMKEFMTVRCAMASPPGPVC